MHQRISRVLIGTLLLAAVLLAASLGGLCHSHDSLEEHASCVFCIAVQQAPLVAAATVVFVAGLAFRLFIARPVALPAAPFFLASGARAPPL